MKKTIITVLIHTFLFHIVYWMFFYSFHNLFDSVLLAIFVFIVLFISYFIVYVITRTNAENKVCFTVTAFIANVILSVAEISVVLILINNNLWIVKKGELLSGVEYIIGSIILSIFVVTIPLVDMLVTVIIKLIRKRKEAIPK